MKRFLPLLLLLFALPVFAQVSDPYARRLAPSTFTNLGTPANGSIRYCSNCQKTSPCTSGGTGAYAVREAGAWNCGGGGTSAVSSFNTRTGAITLSSVDVTDALTYTPQPTDADLTAIAGLSPSNDDILQRKSGAWTNRTLAQIKADLALNNVDNTSDATKNAATATLTNKTLTAPAITSPTGIVKGDTGLGNVDNTSDANKPVSTATQTALNLKSPITSVQASSYNICSDAGANDTYACNLSPTLGAYVTGQVVWFKANTANTGAATLALNGLSAITIKKQKDQTLADNDIKAGQWVAVQYDGTNFQMISPVSNVGGGSGDVVGPASSVDNNIVLFDSTTGKLIKDSGVVQPKVYIALLTQTGTDAPVATVLVNTLGDTITWSRDSAGTYTGQPGGTPFTTNKTVISMGVASNVGSTIGSSASFGASVAFDIAVINLTTTFQDINSSSGGKSDDLLLKTMIRIEVYP